MFYSYLGNLRQLHDEYWAESRKFNLVTFWNDAIPDDHIRKVLLSENCGGSNSSQSESSTSGGENTSRDDVQLMDCDEHDTLLDDDYSRDLFCLHRNPGVRDAEGQRVLQIATILRNASFEESNTQILGNSRAALR